VKASNANVTAQENELKRIQALVDAGSANTGMLLAAKSQMANAKSSLVQTNSAYKTNLLNLKNLLLLPYSQVFEIKPSAAIIPTSGTFPIPLNELIDSAIQRRPEYKSQNLRKKSSELSVKIAKGALYPSVFLGGSLNSVYSGNSKAISNVSLAGSQPIGYVTNTNEIVEAPVFNYTLTTIDFGKQVKDNFGQSFGASVNMPIYGKLQARSNISKAELGVLQSELSLKRVEQTITNEVNSAYQAFQNAFAQYSALNENHTAQKQNLEFLRLRFENGQANYFELQLAQTNEIAAYQNMLSAKYELALRNMILEFLYTNQQQLLNNF
jgi:outer membrane protein